MNWTLVWSGALFGLGAVAVFYGQQVFRAELDAIARAKQAPVTPPSALSIGLKEPVYVFKSLDWRSGGVPGALNVGLLFEKNNDALRSYLQVKAHIVDGDAKIVRLGDDGDRNEQSIDGKSATSLRSRPDHESTIWFDLAVSAPCKVEISGEAIAGVTRVRVNKDGVERVQ